MPTFHNRMLVCALAPLLPIQLPARTLGDGPCIWAPICQVAPAFVLAQP